MDDLLDRPPDNSIGRVHRRPPPTSENFVVSRYSLIGEDSPQKKPQARLNMWCGVSRQTRLVHMTVWALLEQCTGQLDEPFRRSVIVDWFRRHHPEVNEATLGAHIQAATENAANRAASP